MPKRILVVDDEEDIARAFEEALSKAGYDVTIATDGYDALEKATAGSYDLITMDLRLPKQDGISTVKQIMDMVRLGRMAKPAVVIISGYVDEHKLELSQVPVRHIIPKPVGVEDLCKIVNRVFEENKPDDF